MPGMRSFCSGGSQAIVDQPLHGAFADPAVGKSQADPGHIPAMADVGDGAFAVAWMVDGQTGLHDLVCIAQEHVLLEAFGSVLGAVGMPGLRDGADLPAALLPQRAMRILFHIGMTDAFHVVSEFVADHVDDLGVGEGGSFKKAGGEGEMKRDIARCMGEGADGLFILGKVNSQARTVESRTMIQLTDLLADTLPGPSHVFRIAHGS